MVFKLSTVIVIDESIIQWYYTGGDWINTGLPMYIDMDQKPNQKAVVKFKILVTSKLVLYYTTIEPVKKVVELTRTN